MLLAPFSAKATREDKLRHLFAIWDVDGALHNNLHCQHKYLNASDKPKKHKRERITRIEARELRC